MKSYKSYIISSAPLCESNIVNTSRLYRYLNENGHEITYSPLDANFIIINSCGFVKYRENRCVDLFNKYNLQKKEDAKIIMFGCLTKINKELVDSLDVISVSFDQGNKLDKIFYRKIKFEEVRPFSDPKTNEKLFIEKNAVQGITIHVFFITKLLMHFFKRARINYQRYISSYTYSNKLFVEINKGCIGNCSYCAIKKARGNVCSRQIKEIITDIETFYDPTKNVFLVSDDCGGYGIDIGTNFFSLIYEIKKRFPELLIELDSLDPFWINKYPDKYISLFKDNNIYISTIPIQSGSNKVLKAMNRNYDIKKVIEIVDEIKKVSPSSFLITNIILGFPGENTSDFLKSLFCSVHFDFPVIIKYSEHKDLKSFSLPNHVSKFTTSMRYTLFTIFLNFIVFGKFFLYRKEK